VNLRILERQLAKWEISVVSCSSGPEALSVLANDGQFDAAIFDMQMPEMDGLELTQRVRARSGRRFPIVLLTSLGRREDGDELFAAQMSKPAKPDALREVLVGVLQTETVAPEDEPSAPDFDGELGDVHPLRILLAEDNPVNQKVAAALLGRMGYEPDAGNGRPRRHSSHPDDVAGTAATPHRCADGECAEGRPGSVPRRRHARLRVQADPLGRADRGAPTDPSAHRLAGSITPRGRVP